MEISDEQITDTVIRFTPQDQIPATDGLYVFYDGDASVVAESLDEAWEILKKAVGYKDDEMQPREEWMKIHPERFYNIELEDGKRHRKTVAEWIRENGKGYLCSENF